MYEHSDKLMVWGREIDSKTLQQAARASRLPFVYSHMALMPDAHFGIGATVGSVIPTKNAIIPAAVGVDIGCGMIAVKTVYRAEHLPDDLSALMPLVEKRIPAGVGQGHERGYKGLPDVLGLLGEPFTELTGKQRATTDEQFGTLGSGNHFVEVCIGLDGSVWCVLHSGSRGIGNQLARYHIDKAKSVIPAGTKLEDPDLAFFTQGTDEFQNYIIDMHWAQEYAFQSREKMMDALLFSLEEVVRGKGLHETPIRYMEMDRINCHHNFTVQEYYGGVPLWITRKGAIQAREGDRGVIPGSMGSDTYIVEGKGNIDAWCSCSHGAGRRMSRNQARKEITPEQLTVQMANVPTWNASHAERLTDESPLAYKPIEQVMEDQGDLVTVLDRLYQVFNYKGQ